MNISLPESLKAFVDERVESGNYGTSSEYVRELIRRDRDREQLRKLINQGLAAPRITVDEKYWAEKKKRFARRK